jgi:hypothetical protein
MPNTYPGAFGFPVTLNVTPDGEAAVEVLGILTTGLPRREISQEKFIPASGTLAGKEQVRCANEVSADITVNVLYTKTNYGEIDAMKGKTLALSMAVAADAAGTETTTGAGRLKSCSSAEVDPGKQRRAEYVFTWDAGWTIA